MAPDLLQIYGRMVVMSLLTPRRACLGLLALAALCVSAGSAWANTRAATPGRSPASDRPRMAGEGVAGGANAHPHTGAYMPQNDAFQSASEQAAYLMIYQQTFGPYGSAQGDSARQKLIEETAQAIEDCMNGRSCDQQKQERVVQALIHRNNANSIRHQILANNTNRRLMGSLPTGMLSSKDRQAVLKEGASMAGVRSGGATAKSTTSGRANASIERGFGRGVEGYYQLTSPELERARQEREQREREILGPGFVQEYRAFLREASRPVNPEQRFYRYVDSTPQTRGDGSASVYVDEMGEMGQGRVALIGASRGRSQREMMELQNPRIRQIVDGYAERIRTRDDAQNAMRELRIGSHSPTIADNKLGSHVLPGESLSNPTHRQEAMIRAASSSINNLFQGSAEKGAIEQASGDRSLASLSAADRAKKLQEATRNSGVSATSENIAQFDAFLDEIWPSAERRREILSRGPSSTTGAAAPTTSGVSRRSGATRSAP